MNVLLCNEAMHHVEFALESVRKLLANISPGKATGPDDIAAAMINSCSECLYFCHLFQNSLRTSVIPRK